MNRLSVLEQNWGKLRFGPAMISWSQLSSVKNALRLHIL
jgi:hypothetical protein